MKKEIIDHLYSVRPNLDVHGKWIHIPNARTGSKSIARITNPTQILYTRGPRNYDVVWKNLFEPRIDEVFKFTIVRNPWDRAVSAFHMMKKRGWIPKRVYFLSYLHDNLAKQGEYANKHYFAKQSRAFMYKGNFIPDIFIGKFETLDAHWKVIKKEIETDANLPRVNETKHPHYTKFYPEESDRDVIYQIYHEEIEALGYTFE